MAHSATQVLTEQNPEEHASFRVGSRLLFENDRVRVWELRLGPGERSERHRHQADFVRIALTRSRLRVEGPGAAVETSEDGPGFTGYQALTGSVVHTVQNVGGSEHCEILVELKGPDARRETESASNDDPL